MPRDGSGNYNLPAGNPVVFGTDIDPNWANTTLDDIKSALTQSLSKDGQTVPTANLPMGGFKLTNVGAPSVNGDVLVWGQNATVAALTATTLAGSGASITNLNASNLASGTVPGARFPSVLPAVSGANLTNLNAGALASGTVPDARFPAVLPAVSGANLTNLNASALASGTVPNARVAGTYTGITAIGNGGNHLSFSAAGNLTISTPSSGSSLVVEPGASTTAIVKTNSGGGCIDLYGRSADSLSVVRFMNSVGGGVVGAIWADSASCFRVYRDNLATVALDVANSGASTFYGRAKTNPASVAFSATPTFDAATSNVFYFGTLTGNVTSMTISNPSDGQTIQIRFVQDATGSRTVALPSGAVVSGSINSAANSVTWLVMTYVSSYARWEGTWTRIS